MRCLQAQECAAGILAFGDHWFVSMRRPPPHGQGPHAEAGVARPQLDAAALESGSSILREGFLSRGWPLPHSKTLTMNVAGALSLSSSAEELRPNLSPRDRCNGARLDFTPPAFGFLRPQFLNIGIRRRFQALDEQAGKRCAIGLRQFERFSEYGFQVASHRRILPRLGRYEATLKRVAC